MIANRDLLRRFVDERSESAFRELVERHMDMVFSVALRRLGGDSHLAEDATQEVFVAFARKAGSIKPECLSGWLHQHACFVTANLVRSQRRRKERESNALPMNPTNEPDNWKAVAPELDEAIDALSPDDREIILLRFFSKQNFQSIAESFGISEDAAQKRVSRTLEKLQMHFKLRGVALSVAGLAAILTTQAVTAAPAAFTAGVATSAFASTQMTATLFNLLTMAKVNNCFLLTVAIAAIVAPAIYQHQIVQRLRAQNMALQFQATRSSTRDPVAKTDGVFNVSPDTELLALRSEVGLLKSELASRTNAPRKVRVLSPEDFDSFQPSMDQDEIRQILTFDSLRDAGFETPEAAVETYLWAMRQTLNTNTFAQAQARVKEIVFLPPGAKFSGFNREGNHDPVRDSKFLKIEAVTFPTPDTAKILINDYDDASFRRGTAYHLVRDQDGWKIDLGLHAAN